MSAVSFESNQLVIGLLEKMDFYCEKLSGDDLGRMLRCLTEEALMNVLIRVDAQKEDTGSGRHPLTLRTTIFSKATR